MTNITTIIDQESGIQYQGAEDRSSRTGIYPVIGLIAGKFRRGRYDKPMIITNENIKAQLGYDPTNPHYMAVQDVISSGVQSVQVLRVDGGGLSGNFPKLNCSMASIGIYIAPDFYYGEEGEVTYSVYVNNILVGVGSSNGVYIEELLVDYFRNQNMQARAGYSDGAFVVNLNESKPLQLRFIPSISYDSTQMKFYDLHSNHLISGSEELNFESGELNLIEHNALTIGEDGSIHVCLAPYIPPIVVEPVSYILTIDDKGLVPIDGIYSGTITPPLPNIELGFNIQQYLSNGSNGRVFNIHTSPDGLRISPDGGSWTVDKALVASYWDFPTAEDFTTPATYSLSIATMNPALAVTPADLDYVVEAPFSILPSDLVFKTTSTGTDSVTINYHTGDSLIELSTRATKARAQSAWDTFTFNPSSDTWILRKSAVNPVKGAWIAGGSAVIEVSQFPESEYTNRVSFVNAYSLTKVPNYLPPTITSLNTMFASCQNFNQDLSSWDTANVTDLGGFLSGALTFNSPLFSDVRSVVNMETMLLTTPAFNQDLSKWCVPNITEEPYMFSSNSALTAEHKPVWGTCPVSVDDSPKEYIEFTTNGEAVYFYGMVEGDRITGPNGFNQEILYEDNNYNLPAGTYKVQLTNQYMRPFNLQITGNGLTEVLNFPTTERPTRVFFGGNIMSAFNLVKVPTYLPPKFTDLTDMFYNCENLVGTELSQWDVSAVTKMTNFLYRARAFNGDISGWDTSNVIDMYSMFRFAIAFNQPIGNWKVGNVTNMAAMFNYTEAFNQDLTKWCVTNIPSMPPSFNAGSVLENSKLPVWGTCPNGS